MVTKKHIFASLFCLAFLLAGCQERTINPFEENVGVFSAYGALNMDETTHVIRVNDVQTPVISREQTLQADVSFTDVETGTTTTLRDSIIDFSGYLAHNFVLDYKLEYRSQYTLTAQHPDGNGITSTITTPGITELEIHPNENVGCNTQIEFTFNNVIYPEHVQMEVGFTYQGEIHWARVRLVDQLQHRENSNEMFIQLTPRNLLVEVFPPEPFPVFTNPRFIRPSVTCQNLISNVVHIRYKHFGPEWDIFSPGWFPNDPLSWQDVEGGLGFVGAFREGSATFTINLPEN